MLNGLVLGYVAGLPILAGRPKSGFSRCWSRIFSPQGFSGMNGPHRRRDMPATLAVTAYGRPEVLSGSTRCPSPSPKRCGTRRRWPEWVDGGTGVLEPLVIVTDKSPAICTSVIARWFNAPPVGLPGIAKASTESHYRFRELGAGLLHDNDEKVRVSAAIIAALLTGEAGSARASALPQVRRSE